MTRAAVADPAVGTTATWTRFLLGFLVLRAVFAGASAPDPTARGAGGPAASALLHAAIDSFKVVVLPAAALAVYPLLIIGFSLAVPLLVLLVPSRKDVLR